MRVRFNRNQRNTASPTAARIVDASCQVTLTPKTRNVFGWKNPGSERAVITYHATASDAPGMQKSITLQSSGSYDRTGTRTQADQELQMKGTGTRQGLHQLGLDGSLVSAQGHESGDMTITVPTVGQTVPVKQSGSYSITSSASR